MGVVRVCGVGMGGGPHLSPELVRFHSACFLRDVCSFSKRLWTKKNLLQRLWRGEDREEPDRTRKQQPMHVTVNQPEKLFGWTHSLCV